jgi:hypothetical protein
MKKPSLHARVPLALATVLGLSITLAGCSSDPEEPAGAADSSQTTQAATPPADENPPADDTPDGGLVDEDNVVPDWVTEGFPIYPDSRVAASSDGGTTFIVSFSVPAAEERTIYDWFVDQYSQNGWVGRDFVEDSGSFEADNADGRTVSIDVTKSTFVMTAQQG